MSPEPVSPSTPESADLVPVVEPVVRASGLDLEDLVVSRAGRRRRVLVLVDRDGGVTLDECAEVSQRLSAALDASDALGDLPYVLEVGSPGVERPLTAPRHWRRNVGRLVRVVDRAGDTTVGRVLAADDDGADLDVDGRGRRLRYDEVARARVQVEFNRPAPADADSTTDED